jgi:hypothetical protein
MDISRGHRDTFLQIQGRQLANSMPIKSMGEYPDWRL